LSYLRVKVCGVTTEEDALAAVESGADAIGLNFYPRSPRYLSPAEAPAVLRALPPFVEAVALFVGEPLAQVAETSRRLGRIGAVQWHGEHHEVADLSPLQLITAFSVRDAQSLSQIEHHLNACRAASQFPAAVLVDAHVRGLYGGTGRCAPWELIAKFRLGVPLILAGGLTADNVAEAVRLVRPYAVDVASGVESSVGRKDPKEMRRFIENAREAAAGLGPV
jgi:phosphoribosylanthranilate isomerase